MKQKTTELQRKDYQKKSLNFDKGLLKIKVSDNGEPLVSLTTLVKKRKTEVVFSENASKSPFLRESVAEALLKAAKNFLKLGYTLKLESAFRSLDEQRNRFERRYKQMEERYPGKPKQALLKLANTYTAGIPVLSSHTAGAAVDVVLLQGDGEPLDFGVSYPYGDIESATDYPYLSPEVKINRKTLKEGMEKYGLINYPFEYWHYSAGDVSAAYLTGKKAAIYAPLKHNIKTNSTVAIVKSSDLYSFFEI